MKVGYKQTELGIIPEDWSVFKFTDIAELIHGFQFREEHFCTNGKYSVVKIGNLSSKGQVEVKNISQTDCTNIKNFERLFLKKGDILMALTGGTLGKVAIFDLEEDKYLQNYRVGKFISNEKSVSSYLAFLLKSHYVQNRIMDNVNEAAQPNFGKQDFDKIKIPLPPIEEQNAIANCLSTWDEAIEKQQKLIEAKEIRHKALMQKLLSGKKRLPGFTDEWKEVKIKHLGEIKTGNTPSKNNSDYWGDEFYWCTADDMKNKYIYHTKQRLSSLGKEKARIVPENSILVTCIASIGINAITKVKTGFNQQINSITPNNNFDVEFIYYLINNNKSKLLEYAGAGALPMLNKNTFMEIAFKIPVLNEQLAISNILKTSEAEIEIEKQKVEQLKEQKKALMQKLLTGKVRLPLQN